MTRAVQQIRDIPVEVFGGRLVVHVKTLGDGEPLVYLHGATGLAVDGFVRDLARNHTVFAPEFPGTSTDNPYAVHRVDDLWDLVLVYDEVVRAVAGWGAVAVGASFGGMLAAEVAATFPEAFRALVLLDPLGLWHADAPVADWISAAPEDLPAMLFHDPDGPAARAMLGEPGGGAPEGGAPDGGAPDVDSVASMIWAIGCTGRFVWPIPERGLAKRLHRITAPTLVVWGQQDRLVPVGYGSEFQRLIPDARLAVIPDSGHFPHIEQREAVLRAVSGFLDGLARTF